jgi:hypothetical protein
MYLKGLYKLLGWVLHSKTIHKVHMNVGPQTLPFKLQNASGSWCTTTVQPCRARCLEHHLLQQNNRSRRTHCVAPTLTWFESCGLLHVGTLRSPCLFTVYDVETLQQRIFSGCHTIRNIADIFERIRQWHEVSRHVLLLTEDIFSASFKCIRELQHGKEVFVDSCSHERYVLFFCVQLTDSPVYTGINNIWNLLTDYTITRQVKNKNTRCSETSCKGVSCGTDHNARRTKICFPHIGKRNKSSDQVVTIKYVQYNINSLSNESTWYLHQRDMRTSGKMTVFKM